MNARPAGLNHIPAMFILVGLIIGLGMPIARAQEPVQNFLHRVTQASLELWSSGSEQDARQRCRQLVAWAFDVTGMARNALGKFWDTTPAAERRKYVAAFEQALVTQYVRRVAATRGTNIAFIGARAQRDGQQLAATRLALPDRPEQTWIWRLRPAGASWRVVEVTVDGRSALRAERQEFARIMETSQGDIDAVIAYIRRREASEPVRR